MRAQCAAARRRLLRRCNAYPEALIASVADMLLQTGRPRKYDLPAEAPQMDAAEEGAAEDDAPRRKGGRTRYASKVEALARR